MVFEVRTVCLDGVFEVWFPQRDNSPLKQNIEPEKAIKSSSEKKLEEACSTPSSHALELGKKVMVTLWLRF